MKSLFVLILMWLVFQFGSLLLSGKPSQGRPSARAVDALLAEWPVRSRNVARGLIDHYGLPDGVFRNRLRWNREGEVGIVLYRESDRSTEPLKRPARGTPSSAAPALLHR